MSSATVEPHEKTVGCCAWALLPERAVVVRVLEYAEGEHDMHMIAIISAMI